MLELGGNWFPATRKDCEAHNFTSRNGAVDARASGKFIPQNLGPALVEEIERLDRDI